MKISYGPPGVSGVKHLQYLSGDAPNSAPSKALPVAKIAGVVWLGAKITGMSRVKRYAFWTAIGALVWHYSGTKGSSPTGMG
ncbi:hypothetical protein LCGC14_2248480 [marine sediment metagenome]|uniref:Uncharacterized protein n=1 Tax=marine sediment metagenome TaxID=412755 RepID=A0A0F9FFU3_9ZZZZ